MIKIGISGGLSPVAGELLRILINHPDVEIIGCYAPSNTGEFVGNVHYGLIGETQLTFSERPDFNKIDALFVCSENESSSHSSDEMLQHALSLPDIRIIDLTRSDISKKNQFTFGLSEIYRKPLVRGERRAFLPYPEESVALIALYPLAANLLLPGDIDIKISAPKNFVDNSRLNKTAAHIAAHLQEAQKSYSGEIHFVVNPEPTTKALRIQFTLPLAIDLETIEDMFEGIYDDHNFTFHTRCKLRDEEVIGTNKCLLTINKPDAASVTIEAIADPKMRGGAAEGVHLMNLLFGLSERTGLCLKASGL